MNVVRIPTKARLSRTMGPKIDKSRSRTREVLTGKRRSDSSMFDLTVNATGWDIKPLTSAVADFAMRWFEARDEKTAAAIAPEDEKA